jgi:hypothetical protein
MGTVSDPFCVYTSYLDGYLCFASPYFCYHPSHIHAHEHADQIPRECWCSHSLAGIAEKLNDEECDLACEGDDSMACGGNLKLSVYKLSESGAVGRIHPSQLLSAGGAALGIFVLL